MGYDTKFTGGFTLDKPLSVAQYNYLKKFANTRRMRRDALATAKRPDEVREAVGLPVGPEGAYFVGAGGSMGQEYDAPDILDRNVPPEGQPGLWCQWVPNDDGTAIVWDYGEKFYDYERWLKYLIDNFLAPWGFTLNGEVVWQGEDIGDIGRLCVEDNRVFTGGY